ncbi:MAG: TIR domain-containing protein [Propionibacteriaceae bacterium]|jgi:hypothetical protein|nr:TIR domain-containing protein [Propionibacteriaceae bacterium]
MLDSLRLFLSYGHDDNAPLVTRIHHDLEARGHQVWIDQQQIKAGRHWRRAIYDGIKESSGVVAFLSKHSTRDPGTCRDELRIAVAAKGCYIQTVLLEPEAEVQPPAIITEVQWLDLSQWREVETQGNEAFEAWYKEQFEKLCGAVESSEAVAFHGEIEELTGYLHPILLDQKQQDLLADAYTGREWLAASVEHWRVNQRDSKAFVLFGTPGAGKSAFCVDRLAADPHAVCGVLCEWDKPASSDPAQVVKTMAFKLACKVPDYRAALLDISRQRLNLQHAGVSELFAWLITQPLSLLASAHDRDRIYIVLDALDECSNDDLSEMLAVNLKYLPPWIGLLITSRPEPDLVSLFEGFDPVVLDANSTENTRDIRSYFKSAFDESGTVVPTSSLNELAMNAEGSFWWAKLMCEHVIAHGLSDAGDEAKGLSGLYRQWFMRAFPDPESWSTARSFLELMLADEALSERLLMAVARRSLYDLSEFRHSAGSLLVDKEIRYTKTTMPSLDIWSDTLMVLEALAFCHKSVADWLAHRPTGGAYFVDRRQGGRRLVNYLNRMEAHYRRSSTTLSIGDPAAYELGHLRTNLWRYYALAEMWEEYEAALLGDRRFGVLWDGIDSFPPYWDMSSIYNVLGHAYRQPWDDIRRAKYGVHDLWKHVFGVIRRAARGPRLVQQFLAMLRGPERLDAYFRSGASELGDAPGYKERVAEELVGALKRCDDLGVPIPEDVQLFAARVAASSQYWGLTAPNAVWRSESLIRHPLLYSYGVFDDPEAEASQPLGQMLPERAVNFNYCAAAYEFTNASTPNEQRLRRILAAGADPGIITSLAFNVANTRGSNYFNRFARASDVNSHAQVILNRLTGEPRWHPVQPRLVCASSGDGFATVMFDCCGLEVDIWGQVITRERLDGCQLLPGSVDK